MTYGSDDAVETTHQPEAPLPEPPHPKEQWTQLEPTPAPWVDEPVEQPQATPMADATVAVAQEPPPEEPVVPRAPAGVIALNGPLIANGSGGAGLSPRRRPGKGIIAGGLVVALLAGTLAYLNLGPGAPSAEAAVYARVFTPDDRHEYRFRFATDGTVSGPGVPSQSMQAEMSARVVDRVVGVDDDGIATIESKLKGLNMRVDGATVPMPFESATMTARIAPDGRVLSVDGVPIMSSTGIGPASDMFGPTSMGPLLPSDAVAPGDTWVVSEKLPLPFGEGAMEMTARNRLIALRVVDGVEAAVIQSDLHVPMNMRMTVRDLIAAAEEAGTTIPDVGMPANAAFVYDGEMKLRFTQTIERATSRPLSVVGDGTMKISMSATGMPGFDGTMSVDQRVEMTLHEV